jgi:hypothetical protein
MHLRDSAGANSGPNSGNARPRVLANATRAGKVTCRCDSAMSAKLKGQLKSRLAVNSPASGP